MKLKKHSIYEITWIDTFGYNGWYDEKDIDDKTDIKLKIPERHVGYLIKETKKFVILAMGIENENKDFLPYNSPKWIPKGFIIKIKPLK